MSKYQIQNDLNGNPCAVIVRDGDLIHNIPFDPNNADYQIYLNWLAEGNQPLPAES